jgi:predicted DNA binding CopG/RHH family protein
MEKKMNRIKINYTDDEEKKIVESLKDIDINSIKSDKKNIKLLQEAAKDYIVKQDRRITIRISSEDLDKIKKSASEKGLRYQTFIKSIIHQNI